MLLRELTYKKVTSLVAELFSPDVQNMDQIFLEAMQIMPMVEKFLTEKLNPEEKATVEIQSERELFEFIMYVGDSLVQQITWGQ